MAESPHVKRWPGSCNLTSLLASLVLGAMTFPARCESPQGAKPAPPAQAAPKPNLGRPPDPNVRATNAQVLNEEIADSLENRFRATPKQKGDIVDSENVLARPVKKVVVDEGKLWRDRIDSALRSYEQSTTTVDQKAAEDLLIGIVTSPDAPVDVQRECMKHLAQIALDGRFYSRAQQIYSQLVSRFPLHPDTPAVLYRQGVLYRRIGATELALSKFHAVMSTVISLPEKDLSTYKSLVLMAQTEIADTFFLAGQFDRASEYYRRVLKLADEDLNEAQVRLKLVKSVFELKDWKGVIAEGQQCIEKIALSTQIAEVRFLMAEAFKKMGMQREALEQTMALLNAEQARSGKDPDNWAYWQKRTGNKLANELYEQGDYVHALLIYETLGRLPGDEEWHSQALYQMGLIYERMFQPERASEAYTRILSTSTNAPALAKGGEPSAAATASATNNAPTLSATNVPPADTQHGPGGKSKRSGAETEPPPAISPGLKLIREMAAWRLGNLRWDQGVNKQVRNLFLGAGSNASEPSTEGSAGPNPPQSSKAAP